MATKASEYATPTSTLKTYIENIPGSEGGGANAPDSYVQANFPTGTLAGKMATMQNQSAESLAATPARSMAAFFMRGGLTADLTDAIQRVGMNRVRQNLDKEYQKLLLKQEAGAKDYINSAVKKYGPGVQEYLPPIELFYDRQTGSFMPHEYYKAGYVGVEKYKDLIQKQQEEAEKRYKERLALDVTQQSIAQRPQEPELQHEYLQRVAGMPQFTTTGFTPGMEQYQKTLLTQADLERAKLRKLAMQEQQRASRGRDIDRTLMQIFQRQDKAEDRKRKNNDDMAKIQEKINAMNKKLSYTEPGDARYAQIQNELNQLDKQMKAEVADQKNIEAELDTYTKVYEQYIDLPTQTFTETIGDVNKNPPAPKLKPLTPEVKAQMKQTFGNDKQAAYDWLVKNGYDVTGGQQ